MITIWGRVSSSNVMKALWALDEIGLDYTRIDAGMEFGVNDTSDYLAMNPNGRVPTLKDDDLILWESNAILRYLAAKYDDGGLWPADLAARADLDRWMDWQQTTAGPAMTPIFWGLVRTAPAERDNDAIAASIKATSAAFDILEVRLQGQAYIGGDRLSIADIPMGPVVHRWYGIDFDKPKAHPSVRAWYDRLCERPAFRKNIADIPIT